MSTEETIVQAFREFAKAYALPGTPLTDDQVIPEDDDGGRPAIPYATVFAALHGVVTHHDELVHSISGGSAAQYVRQGERSGVIQFHSYGSASAGWHEDLTLALADPEVQRINNLAGLVVLAPVSGRRSLPRMMNANRERHYVTEFPYTYRVVSATVTGATVVQLDLVTVDGGLYTTDPDSDTVVIDVDVTVP